MLLSKIQNFQKLAIPYPTKRCLKRCLGREQSFGKGFTNGVRIKHLQKLQTSSKSIVGLSNVLCVFFLVICRDVTSSDVKWTIQTTNYPSFFPVVK